VKYRVYQITTQYATEKLQTDTGCRRQAWARVTCTEADVSSVCMHQTVFFSVQFLLAYSFDFSSFQSRLYMSKPLRALSLISMLIFRVCSPATPTASLYSSPLLRHNCTNTLIAFVAKQYHYKARLRARRNHHPLMKGTWHCNHQYENNVTRYERHTSTFAQNTFVLWTWALGSQ